MDKTNSADNGTQGSSNGTPTPDIETIEKWLTRDLGSAITFLTAVHNDTDLKRTMAIFLQGRINNAKHKPDPSQINLFTKPQPVD